MPTFTAIALDTLLETGSQNHNHNHNRNHKLPPHLAKPQLPPVHSSEQNSVPLRPPHAPSPILYATPDVTPLPDSPSSFPPSPYIINHKRRGPRLLKSLSHNSVIGREPQSRDSDFKVEATSTVSSFSHNCLIDRESQSHDIDFKVEATSTVSAEQDARCRKREEVVNEIHDSSENGVARKEEAAKAAALEIERDGEIDEFLDFQDSMGLSSNTEVDESNRGDRLWKPGTPGDYYDAFEEISSDGTAKSSYRNLDDDLREMRLNLLMEIERRKQAEDALEHLQNQWNSLSQQLLIAGLTFPTIKALTDEAGESSNLDPAEDLCQQIVVTRLVADTIARGCLRAEVEMEMEPLIEAKNFEIARLSDRLQYYEAANREMSQRNQEAVEMARQQRRRKRTKRWIWSSIGLAVTLGAAAVAWSYFPASKPSAHHEGETSESHGDQT